MGYRPDSIGLFWQDVPQPKGKGAVNRVMPDIPETNWRAPREFPNLSGAPYLSLDIETKDPELSTLGPGWARGSGHIIGISIGVPGKNWYFPMRHEVLPEQNLDPVHVMAWAKDTLKNPLQPKIGANLIYDVGWLEHEGVEVKGTLYDVQYAEALLDETALTNLDELGHKYLGTGKDTPVLYQWACDYYGGNVNDQRKNLYRCPPCLVGPYAEMDTDLPQRILPLQWAHLQQQGLLELFEMECRLVPLLIAMRRAGVTVDIDKATQIKEGLAKRVQDLNAQIKHLVGFDVNVDANDSIQKAFRQMGVPIPMSKPGRKKDGTPKAPSPTFTKDTLGAIDHQLPELILECRKLDKVAETFIQSYILDSHVNGKVYCEFHPLRGDRGGTRSGRFASSNPNLQNVPSRDEELAPMVRGAFVPDPGHFQWRRYDYSQIEYRGLAHYAIGGGADELRARYIRDPNTDYHEATQEMVKRMTGQEIARKPIKNINFGLIYGLGEPKLARTLGLSTAEGKALFNAYHEGAPFAKATMDHFSKMARNLGYVQTILGRRSRFDLWEADDYGSKGEEREPALPYLLAVHKYGRVKRAYSHKGLNRVLQGSAADLMKVAMLKCWESGVFSYTGVPRLTVHDELDFSDPGGQEHAFAYIKEILETAIPFRVPIRAELEVGPSWGSVA